MEPCLLSQIVKLQGNPKVKPVLQPGAGIENFYKTVKKAELLARLRLHIATTVRAH